jgi:hypothetical protein
LVESCFRGAFPPVDLRADCLQWAIYLFNNDTVHGGVLRCESVVRLAGIPWFIMAWDIHESLYIGFSTFFHDDTCQNFSPPLSTTCSVHWTW